MQRWVYRPGRPMSPGYSWLTSDRTVQARLADHRCELPCQADLHLRPTPRGHTAHRLQELESDRRLSGTYPETGAESQIVSDRRSICASPEYRVRSDTVHVTCRPTSDPVLHVFRSEPDRKACSLTGSERCNWALPRTLHRRRITYLRTP